MQSIGLSLHDCPLILVHTKDAAYYCTAIMTGVPSSRELCLISQNHTQILKIEEVREIKLIEWRNPISEIISTDIEIDCSNGAVLQRVAPSETEIKEEEESIRKWKEGKLG